MDGDGLCVSFFPPMPEGMRSQGLTNNRSMLGSLTLYRRLLHENVFSKPEIRRITPFARYQPDPNTLPSFGHGIAGIMAGTTVSFIAAPVEHVKARLQIQYAADKTKRMYSGPIDCTRKIVSTGHRS
jgi:solute carrier family 25 carnitine/acylcarnitine transporter 20/29